MKRSLCLLTNDDGPGELLEAARTVGLELFSRVATIVPSRNQSAVAAAVTLGRSVGFWRAAEDHWFTDGYPADGVRYAIRHLHLPKPNLVLSGVNNGWNLGRCVINSGTVGAGLEGTRGGVSAVCLSAERGTSVSPEWLEVVTKIVDQCITIIEGDYRELIVLSVNLPCRFHDDRAVFLPVSTVEYDEHYYEVDGQPNQRLVSGSELVVDPLIPDVDLLLAGRAVVNLIPTPWTIPAPELTAGLVSQFPA